MQSYCVVSWTSIHYLILGLTNTKLCGRLCVCIFWWYLWSIYTMIRMLLKKGALWTKSLWIFVVHQVRDTFFVTVAFKIAMNHWETHLKLVTNDVIVPINTIRKLNRNKIPHTFLVHTQRSSHYNHSGISS